MKVFKTYFKIMKKQMVAILLYGVMFLGISLLVTLNIFKSNSESFTVQKVPVIVINQDENSSFVEGFLTYLEKFVSYKELEDNEEARKDALFNRKIDYILTIPEGFTEDLFADKEVTLTKQTIPDSVRSISVDTAIDNYLKLAKVYKKHNPELSAEELNEVISQNLSEDTKVSFDVKQKKDDITSNEFNAYYFNYLGYIMITCFIIGVSTVMLSFHSIEIRRKHNASPVSIRNLNLQLILANLVFVTGYLLVFIIAGYFFNPFNGFDMNLVLFWLNAFLFSLTVLSISYLIGISVKGKNAIQALSTMLSLSLAFISGMFVPQQFLGEPVLKVASFLPSFWYVKANNTIATLTKFSMKNLSEIFGYMAIQIGFALAIISIALVVSKRKRQQAF